MHAAWVGWALAAAALAAGWMAYGWRGVVLAATVIAFWLALQFSRAMRALRTASAAPIGHVASAVMLQSRLKPGMRLAQVIALTGSLGQRTETGTAEVWRWGDAGGAAVDLEFNAGGRLTHWRLQRATQEAHVDGKPDPAGAAVKPDAGS